ncbi:deoxyguanosinetriphosphate triphosphohydrolase [Deinococcus metallilatus]|uniref:Deoxyguanosinetriphosphate triphosphohydrolase-like protein n=1 Tax=Deinococcus metallilatus TaxID=1211322 RepID=A0AAJ5JYY3_9DEIO|nr:deoxyguanosinetriphosphate triphosphohydrolase [Deinococcus metallilatus]MBB5296830.1 dGTPase [Deinococcus metallilatus]QBY09568.1 deoxyguanosinetriphosphate triphosphohydrolase [Deinococcus metallilatus]RXJ09172.1 deoxyguanosinetriphosphate triphosphohydrolase [Deinococcus metallilatus]TLK22784.1 deoxyguanosinetriphosphate triphosphohydrolase [Deinococcus metallilatus]GMA13862.1 deoxyguanosinetriphosphate triphosphohydrolase-like protein 1 [Deinococcus metallilatus]
MFTRADLEAREAATLAPYATLSRDSRGREYPEPESETRTAFQKDRDRILHTTAFRRLESKTQVFLNVPFGRGQGDHYRTRLTHTLEVQQVARSVALMLGLNETLAEAIALAHDLGHPPFGHAGERVLDALMAEYGGFNHNTQARRIVTRLEDRYPGFPGLNLTLDTLDGLNKHDRAGLGPPGLEAQLVDAADALAYTAHDLDDGLRSGLLTPEGLEALPLWQELLSRVPVQSPHLTERDRRVLHRELLGWLIQDLTAASDSAIRASGVTCAAQVRAQPERLITYSAPMRELLAETGVFLRENLYRHWRVEMQVEQGTRLLNTLFTAFLARPSMLPPAVRARAEVDGLPRAVCDFIAGMTDRYAGEMYAALVPPAPTL